VKTSTDLRDDLERLFTAKKGMSRRQFLKAGLGFTAFAGGLGIIAGCATTEPTKTRTLVYPPLPHSKIQPPQEGCFVGFFKEPEASLRQKDSKHMPQRSPEIEAAQNAKTFDEYLETLRRQKFFEERRRHQIDDEIAYVANAIRGKPFLFALPWTTTLYEEFPANQATAAAKKGIVPFVYGGLGPFDLPIPVPGFGPKEIAQGQHDAYIKAFAQGAAEFGKKYGGFFFTTMDEMNGKWFSWGMDSNVIAAWRHVWQLFEDQGANQYATWVWVTYSYSVLPESMVGNPEPYYPGDRYVDWIGFNTFSVAGTRFSDDSFSNLINMTYRQMLKNHPQKPFMISSFGRTNEPYQSKWLIDAYDKIKGDFPAIKAVTYFDNTWKLTGDHTLNQKSLETLKEIFKDPYWVMGK